MVDRRQGGGGGGGYAGCNDDDDNRREEDKRGGRLLVATTRQGEWGLLACLLALVDKLSLSLRSKSPYKLLEVRDKVYKSLPVRKWNGSE